LLMLVSRRAATGKGQFDDLDQPVLGHGLGQEVIRPGLDDLHGRWDVRMPGQKYIGQSRSRSVQAGLIPARSCRGS
jgi:hypothetical protein